MAIPKFHGAFEITASNKDMTVTSAPASKVVNIPLSTTVGDWFIRGYTGEGAGAGRTGAQLLEEIQAQVRTAGGNLTNWTAAVSDTTGKVTLSSDVAFTTTFTDTALRDLLGFTGDLASGTSHTAPNQHQSGWYPPLQLQSRDGDERVAGLVTADVIVSRAPSGRVTTTTFGEFTDRDFAFKTLYREFVFPVLGTGEATRIVNRSWEEFWRQTLKLGKRFRWYPDRTINTATGGGAPFEYVGGKDTARGGTGVVKRTTQTWDEFYDVELTCHLYVA